MIELLVVMVLVAVVAGIGAPSLIGSLEKARLRSSSGKIASYFTATRAKALSEKRSFSLVIDMDKRVIFPIKGKYVADEEPEPIGPENELSDDITIWRDRAPVDFAVVEFNPAGTSSGGIFYITPSTADSYNYSNGYVVVVNPVSGRVKKYPYKKYSK